MAKVMIVDDSETLRQKLKEEIVGAGHTVVEAGDGEQGLRVLDLNPDVRIIICDVNMPVMNGLTMCAKISENTKFKGISVIMLTTEASVSLKEAGKKAGVRAWMTKPHNSPALLAAINKLIAS